MDKKLGRFGWRMSRYFCTYEERSTMVVGDACHTYRDISGQQNKVKRVAMLHVLWFLFNRGFPCALDM